MIIVQITGGLGNQLFQYALAKKIQMSLGYEVKIDISEYKTYKLHKFSLHQCNITLPIATDSEVDNCKSCNTIKEPHFNYWENIFNVSDGSYIVGYWQSELYFKDIRQHLLKEFSLKNPLDNNTLEQWGFNNNESLVSIHIRRGDYVTNPTTNRIHGTCGIEYYMNAVRIIKEKVEEPKFMFFSDDLKWVSEVLIPQLGVGNHQLIDYNGVKNNYLDVYLMSLCEANIIANSTFSWWGAWLNNNSTNIVVAPQVWFADNSVYTDSTIVPLDWIRI